MVLGWKSVCEWAPQGGSFGREVEKPFLHCHHQGYCLARGSEQWSSPTSPIGEGPCQLLWVRRRRLLGPRRHARRRFPRPTTKPRDVLAVRDGGGPALESGLKGNATAWSRCREKRKDCDFSCWFKNALRGRVAERRDSGAWPRTMRCRTRTWDLAACSRASPSSTSRTIEGGV